MYYIESLINAGLNILPVKGKRPFIKDWYHKDFTEDWELYDWSKGVGLKCGEASNIICLDFDSTNSVIKERIQSLLPPILSGKIGNTNKLPTIFFNFNNELSHDLKAIEVQLLSTGKQTVLPPTIHPDLKTPFKWVGQQLESCLDCLPDLSKELWDSLVRLDDEVRIKQLTKEVSKTNQTGRNNRLKDQVIAALSNEKDIYDIVDEILEFDQLNHSPPLFTDKSEPYMQKGAFHNALCFVMRIAISFSRMKDFEFEKTDSGIVSIADIGLNIDSINDSESTTEERSQENLNYKGHKYPKMRGVMQDMFKHLYKSAPIPRSKWATATSLITLSTLIGNKVKFRGTYPNLFVMLLGESGYGKDHYQRFPTELFHEIGALHYIGEGQAASDTAIIRNLHDNIVRIDVNDESDTLFKSMLGTQAFTQNLANVYQRLFTSTGKYFTGKTAQAYVSKDCPDGRLGFCHSPYVNLMCVLNISDFRESFKTSLMEKGLGGRFLYFPDNEKKKNQFPPEMKIHKDILAYAKKMIIPKSDGITDKILGHSVKELAIDAITDKKLMEIQMMLDQEKINNENEKIQPVWNRIPQFFLKFVILDCLSRGNFNIDALSLDWGLELTQAYLKNMTDFLDYNLSYTTIDRNEMVIEEAVLKSGQKGVDRTTLSRCVRRLGLKPKEISSILNELQNNETICIAKVGKMKNKTLYFHKNCLPKN